MSLAVRSVAVLWEHRFALVIMLVGLGLLAISAGRNLQQSAELNEVMRLQAGLNQELAQWQENEVESSLLERIAPAGAERLQSMRAEGELLFLTDPACRLHKPRSFIGLREAPDTCLQQIPAQIPRFETAEIVCETGLHLLDLPAAGPQPFPIACLLTVWSSKEDRFELAQAQIHWDEDSPSAQRISLESQRNHDLSDTYSEITRR